jgi:hypothetical protein
VLTGFSGEGTQVKHHVEAHRVLLVDGRVLDALAKGPRKSPTWSSGCPTAGRTISTSALPTKIMRGSIRRMVGVCWARRAQHTCLTFGRDAVYQHGSVHASRSRFFFIELNPQALACGQNLVLLSLYSTWKTAFPALMKFSSPPLG